MHSAQGALFEVTHTHTHTHARTHVHTARGEHSEAVVTQPAAPSSDPLPTSIGRPPSPATLAAGPPEAAAVLGMLHDFLRKVLKLAYFRVGWLCQVRPEHSAMWMGTHDE